VKLLLPGELSKHAISEGTKAVQKFTRWESREIMITFLESLNFIIILVLLNSRSRVWGLQ
jgi:hypothetical protein